MDNSTLDDAGETVDLPDSLLQFRSNLVEVLVDICQLLKSAPFIQKVFNLDSHALLKLVSGFAKKKKEKEIGLWFWFDPSKDMFPELGQVNTFMSMYI